MVAAADAQERAAPERTLEPQRETAEPAPKTHDLSVKLDLGIAFGGDDLANRVANAGDGVVIGLGVASVPFWSGWLGVGGGLDFGFKYTARQRLGGGYALQRWPLTLHLDLLARASAETLVRIAAGPTLELGVEVKSTGENPDPDLSLPNALGYFVEAGIRQRVSGPFAIDAALRWTGVDYDGTDASSIGGFFAIHYVIL
jgi:hypothetical protein